MRPWLLHGHLPGIGDVALSGWFTWLLIALVTGALVAVREAKRSGTDGRLVLQLTAALAVSGLAGGRLGHVLTAERAGYFVDPLRLLRFWEGGMVLYGGLIGAAVVGAWWCRTRRLDLLRTGDVLAPGVAIGIALGRLGCLTAGCCFGRPIDWGSGIEWPWGIVFLSGHVPSALRGIALHPTQVYASLNALLLFGVLSALRRRQAFDGQVVAVFLLAYGATRPVLELFRLDLERGFVLPELLGQALSTSQAVSLPILASGGFLYAWARARARREGLLGLTSAAAGDQRVRNRIESALVLR